MPTRTPRIPDAALARIPGKAQYRVATQGAVVVVGGDHPTLVLPEAHASKWGGECWLRVRHADADEIDRADKAAKAQGKALKTAEKASLRSEKGKPVLDIPPPGKGRRHEIREGSLKWDVVYEDASALPADGIERFQLEFPAGLTWYYQPELTAEEITEGCERPENVVGSYAGYFDRSGRILDKDGEEIANYETGKFAHLYRPEMIDAAGNRCWAVQELVGSELRITLPAEWMATAVYPVRLDPTFGYDSNGGSSASLSPGTLRANINGQAEFNGSVSKITAWLTYFNLNANGVVGARATCGIYDVSGSVPTSLITNGATAETVSSVNIGGASAQFDFNFSASPSITADTDYALAIHSVNTSGSVTGYIKYDTAGGSGLWSVAVTYTAGSLPSSFPSVSPSSSTSRYSIYATYEESGGGGTTHEAALTLSSAGALAPGAAANFSASLALTAEGGISDASAAEYSVAWQAAAQAALVPGGAAVLFAGLALSGSGSLSASATASYAAALGLPVSAELAPSYGSIVTAALALEAVGAMSPAARADYQATLATLAQAGMSAAAAAQLAASWQATVVAALLASTTGLAIDAGVALPCAAALTATGYADLAAALSLTTGASIDPAALQTAFAGLEFSVLAALAATHPDDVATVMRVLVLFRGASPGVDLSGKSPSITIQ